MRASAPTAAGAARPSTTATAPTAAAAAPPPRASDEPTAERRLVTVLFTDLVGFTSLAEDRDPEAVRELLSRYFDTATEWMHAARRDGGEVHRRRGHGGVGHAGRPRGRRRAGGPRRARDGRRRPRPAPRASRPAPGVLTGEAAVTLGATNQGMVAGDLVNTAARLQGIAEPGTVLVGEATRRAAERAIVFEPHRRPLAEGQDQPGPGVACGPRRRAARRAGPRGRARAAVHRPRRGAARAQGGAPRGRARTASGWCRSPGLEASARAGWSGSSRSTSTASPRTSTGTAAARRRTARASRSGRWARWSGVARS